MRSTLALRSFRSCDWYRECKLLSVQKSFSQDCSVISHSFQAGVPDFGQQTSDSKLSPLLICTTFTASYPLVFLVNFEHTLLSISFFPLNTPFICKIRIIFKLFYSVWCTVMNCLRCRVSSYFWFRLLVPCFVQYVTQI